MQTNGALLFREHVVATPDRIAFIAESDGTETRVTYAEFDEAVHRVAAGLSALGLAPADRVLISTQPGPGLLQAVYGTIRAGLTAVLCDPGLPGPTAEAYLADVGCVAAIVEGVGSGVDDAVADSAVPHRFTVSGRWGRPFAELLRAERVALPEHVPPRHPAVAFSTSGSTGRPKMIIKTHEHFHLLSRYRSGAYTASSPGEPGTPTRYLVATSLYHTGGMNAGVMLGLLRGWTGVLAGAFHPAHVLRQLARHRCSTVLFTPSQAAVLLRETALLRDLDLRHLRSVRVASGPSTPELLQRLRSAFGSTEILNVYALTECAPCLGQPPGEQQPLESCGRPWVGVTARVLDDAGRDSAEGELWLRSDLISEGTILDPVTTRERYLDGWLRTKDIFRVVDGWYFFVGRIDDMFVCGGENVFPLQVEQILVAHPDVLDACVVGLPDPALGAVAGAHVVLRPGATASAVDLVDHVRRHAPVHCVPHRIEIVPAIATLGPGKADRRTVRSALEGGGTVTRQRTDGDDVRARIVETWKSVLDLDTVDPDVPFLESGGTSQLAVEIVTRMNALGVPVDLGEFFVDGSLRQLLDSADADPVPGG
ncbi:MULTISPECIES: AMP-binding protein [unclassified Micromonospora]|uniref:AMP-binding protein n=1 Tax=unclassified Micromonospora TaxID=2617518 RepID=UPI001C5D1F2D|nr:AMP-binding protein [Micromonospora sp. RL09-050-HVF-A]MBW4702637.1 AMP-binding protein [Micromonospora sp. RL09-050-HVF-A]